MAKHYAIIQQKEKFSKYGGSVTEITLVGLSDRKEYVTWVDPTNFNSKNWAYIVNRPTHGFILTNLKQKRHSSRTDIINADSDFTIAWEHKDASEVIRAIMSKWAEEDEKSRGPNFDDFFSKEA
jgi:uncharacterized protein YbbC (DUF1343 family)